MTFTNTKDDPIVLDSSPTPSLPAPPAEARQPQRRRDDDDDINLRPGGASVTDIPRPPEGYRDVLSWGIIYKIK
jgi:hypothetical protein